MTMVYRTMLILLFSIVSYSFSPFELDGAEPILTAEQYLTGFHSDDLRERLESLEGSLDLNYDADVKKFTKTYLLYGRRGTERLLSESFYYFPMFDYYFDKYNVPREIKYITLIESALKERRTSKAGAVGLWQFMPATAREYGLLVSSKLDERTNPYKSTEAAAKYLAKLYSQFHDWNLVLLAYNAGPGTVRKAIRNARSRNIAKLMPYLPKQTRKYLPYYAATVYVLNYYAYYDIYPRKLRQSLALPKNKVKVV